MSVFIPFIVFLIVILLFSSLWLVINDRSNPVKRRLESITPKIHNTRVATVDKASFKKAVAFFFQRMFPAKKEALGKNRIYARLTLAGFRSPEALSIFTGIRMFSVLTFPFLSGFIGIILNVKTEALVFILIISGLIGVMMPGYLLDKLVDGRGHAIKKELPGILDLLVIAVESGLGLDAAIKRVTRELYNSSPVLAEEFTLYSLEVRIGISREVALRNLSKRCGTDEVGSLVAMLIQADRFGVSISQSLRVHSIELRTKRRQELEEAAARIPLKLLFPVLFLIFPAIMAVMLGPAIVSIKRIFF